jgi:hypothetical protein
VIIDHPRSSGGLMRENSVYSFHSLRTEMLSLWLLRRPLIFPTAAIGRQTLFATLMCAFLVSVSSLF